MHNHGRTYKNSNIDVAVDVPTLEENDELGGMDYQGSRDKKLKMCANLHNQESWESLKDFLQSNRQSCMNPTLQK